MSEITYKQQEYYSIETIEERLSQALGSDEWNNIKKTDLGQNLLKLGANIVHMDAMAFFTGLDQMFKSTVTLKGYLEEIAKSKGVIPRTYISANLTLSLYSKASIRSFLPMDLSLKVGGKTFYNVGDTTIGQSGNPATLVMYEGSAVREASEAGRPLGSSWSYTQFKAVQSEKIGDRVVRKFIVLPREVYVDSIIVESSVSWDVPFLRWNQVKTWYGVRQTDRAWKLGKDYLGRYIIEFGDGVYGREYPTSEIVGVRYVLSGGSGVEIDDYTNLKLYNQDVNEVTGDFVLGGVSNVVDGQSEVNTTDLHLEIEAADNTRDSLITEDDHQNYLEGRADVLYASVKAERHANPPNLEYFNTVKYAIKPNADGGTFNDADIQLYLGKNGLKTVEYASTQVKRANFNVVIAFSSLAGYTASGIQSQIQSIVETDLSWSGLGFNETISEERIYSLIKDIEGLDVSSVEISVEYIYTNELTGGVEFNFNSGDVIPLRFYPRRFRLYMDSDIFIEGVTARDNGLGYLYGDVEGRERFNWSATGLPANSFTVGDLMLMGQGTNKFSLVDLRKSVGGVSTIEFLSTPTASCWCDRYNEILTVESVGSGNYRIRSYAFPDSFLDMEGFNYVQLSSNYAYTGVTKESPLTHPTGTTTPAAVTYFDSYVYIAWNVTSGNKRLYRYRIMNGAIEAADSTYNSIGYLELSSKEIRSITSMDNAFSDGANVLAIATGGTTNQSGMDVVLDFDIADECVFEQDFFRASIEGQYTLGMGWFGTAFVAGSLYAIMNGADTGGVSVMVKLYSMNADGTCVIKVLSDDSITGLTNIVYSIFNAEANVFGFSVDEYNLYKVGFDDINTPPVLRAGNGAGDLTSIAEIAQIRYDLQELIFSMSITGSLKYESENDLSFVDEEMPILSDLIIYSK
jgi:hypothetical protein